MPRGPSRPWLDPSAVSDSHQKDQGLFIERVPTAVIDLTMEEEDDEDDAGDDDNNQGSSQAKSFIFDQHKDVPKPEIIDLTEDTFDAQRWTSNATRSRIAVHLYGNHPFLPDQEFDELEEEYKDLRRNVVHRTNVERFDNMYGPNVLFHSTDPRRSTKNVTLMSAWLNGKLSRDEMDAIIPASVNRNSYEYSIWLADIKGYLAIQQTKMLKFIREGVRATVAEQGGITSFLSASRHDKKKVWLNLAKVNPVSIAENMYPGLADVVDFTHIFTAPKADAEAQKWVAFCSFLFETACNLTAETYLKRRHNRKKIMDLDAINLRVNDAMHWAKATHELFRREVRKEKHRRGLRLHDLPVLPL